MSEPATPLASAPAAAPCKVDWGRVEYLEARRRQLEIWDRRLRGEGEDTIVSVEHPPVVTLGRHAPGDDVLLDQRALAAEGIALAPSDRGGRATYHGPGQAVIYPIVAIGARALGVRQWVAMLEDALLATLAAYAIDGRRIEGRPGIWVGDAKIASIGLRVARGVSYHGVSINVEPRSTSGFKHIVTCGVAGQRVTSIHDELHALSDTQLPSVSEVATRFGDALTERLTGATRR
jgi:lipoate-protein ligase B